MKRFFKKVYIRIIYILKYKNNNQKGTHGIPGLDMNIKSKKKIREEKEEFNQFLDFASTNITPNQKDVHELISFIESKYGAKKYIKEPREYRLYLYNLLHNKFAEIFNDTLLYDFEFVDFIKDPPNRSIESQKQVDYLLDKVKEYGIKLVFYRFIDNPDSPIPEHRYFEVGIETTSRKLSVSRSGEDSRKIREDIILYYGVNEDDIKNKTSAFIDYSIYLRDSGILSQ